MRLPFFAFLVLLCGCSASTQASAGQASTSAPVRIGDDAALVELGRVTFRSAGCITCHRREGLGGTDGPDLDALAGVADPTYVRESILEPDAVVVPGYEDIEMPTNYAEMLTEAELDALQYYLSNRLD